MTIPLRQNVIRSSSYVPNRWENGISEGLNAGFDRDFCNNLPKFIMQIAAPSQLANNISIINPQKMSKSMSV